MMCKKNSGGLAPRVSPYFVTHDLKIIYSLYYFSFDIQLEPHNDLNRNRIRPLSLYLLSGWEAFPGVSQPQIRKQGEGCCSCLTLRSSTPTRLSRPLGMQTSHLFQMFSGLT